MLNILSFFLIKYQLITIESDVLCFDAQYFELFLNKSWRDFLKYWYQCFDAQYFELFLNDLKQIIYGDSKVLVSMLNILSFFLIAHSTTTVNKYPLRYLSEKNYSCDIFSHFYHHLEIKKAVANCSEKILKLKIISPLSVYKNYKKKQRYLQKNLTLTSDFLRSK